MQGNDWNDATTRRTKGKETIDQRRHQMTEESHQRTNQEAPRSRKKSAKFQFETFLCCWKQSGKQRKEEEGGERVAESGEKREPGQSQDRDLYATNETRASSFANRRDSHSLATPKRSSSISRTNTSIRVSTSTSDNQSFSFDLSRSVSNRVSPSPCQNHSLRYHQQSFII